LTSSQPRSVISCNVWFGDGSYRKSPSPPTFPHRLFTRAHIATERPEHAGVGPHFLTFLVVLEPVPVHLRAGGNQKRDNLHVACALRLGRGIKPAVERPSQWRIRVPSVFQIDGRFPFQQQPDDTGVSAICGLMQSGFSVGHCVRVHAVLQQESDNLGPTIPARPHES
jgi:hypothetical protein